MGQAFGLQIIISVSSFVVFFTLNPKKADQRQINSSFATLAGLIDFILEHTCGLLACPRFHAYMPTTLISYDEII